MPSDLPIDDDLVIPGRDLSWTAVRSGGPGGQNVNKVASKVELRFDLEGTEALDAGVKARLRRQEKGRLDAEGRLLITSQTTRNRLLNLRDARDKLAAMIRTARVKPKKRRPTRPTAGAKRRRLTEKRQRSEKKRHRQSVRRGED